MFDSFLWTAGKSTCLNVTRADLIHVLSQTGFSFVLNIWIFDVFKRCFIFLEVVTFNLKYIEKGYVYHFSLLFFFFVVEYT